MEISLNWLYSSVAVLSLILGGVWKAFVIMKELSVLEVKLEKLDEKVEKNAHIVNNLELRIVESLRRIEDRLNDIVDNNSK